MFLCGRRSHCTACWSHTACQRQSLCAPSHRVRKVDIVMIEIEFDDDLLPGQDRVVSIKFDGEEVREDIGEIFLYSSKELTETFCYIMPNREKNLEFLEALEQLIIKYLVYPDKGPLLDTTHIKRKYARPHPNIVARKRVEREVSSGRFPMFHRWSTQVKPRFHRVTPTPRALTPRQEV